MNIDEIDKFEPGDRVFVLLHNRAYPSNYYCRDRTGLWRGTITSVMNEGYYLVYLDVNAPLQQIIALPDVGGSRAEWNVVLRMPLLDQLAELSPKEMVMM